MRAARGHLPLLIALGACAPQRASTGPVFLDGLFDDWGRASIVVEDDLDASDAPVDIRSVFGRDDPEWLYLAIDLGREVNIQSLPGTLELHVDADADPATGGAIDDMDGVDLVLELSQTEEPLEAGRGSGFALRTVADDGSRGGPMRYVAGVTAAPSWAAPRHELRLARAGADGVPPLGRTLRIRAVFVGVDGFVDGTSVGAYTFRTREGRLAPTSAEVRLAKPIGTWRVSQWNVSSESFLERPEGFARVLAAVEPDVVLLDELPGDVTHADLETFFSLEPLASRGSWRHVLGESGGRQRTAVAALDRDVRLDDSMRRVTYADGALQALADGASPAFERLLELEANRQISATGAWVTLDSVDVLFVALDLQSAGWTGSPQDRLRLVQAASIRAHVEAALVDSNSPVVVGGDLNLVGSDLPLRELSRALDVDGSDLAVVDARRLGERTFATWRNARGLFAPGRLDYLLVPDRRVTVANSFVFTTEDLAAPTLRRLGLERDLSASLSDHLVVTADLRFRRD